jgi:hypothetical protein
MFDRGEVDPTKARFWSLFGTVGALVGKSKYCSREAVVNPVGRVIEEFFVTFEYAEAGGAQLVQGVTPVVAPSRR